MKSIQSFSILVIALITFQHVVATKKGAPTYLFQMKGTAVAEMRPNPLDPTQELPCFDVPLHDLVTGEVLGMGTDCLSVAEDQESCNGLEVTATTIFKLKDGSLTLKGLTSVQPTTFGSSEVTHITGAIPQVGENSIISGDGIYNNASGSVRLSGAVNMANMESKGEATFDCLWVVYLDNPIDETMDNVISQAVKATAEDSMAERFVLQMKGTSAAEIRANPLDLDQELPCFDVPLVDLTTGDIMGLGTDCLSVAGPDECGGLQVTATTVFQFDDTNSLFVTGETSVQPITFGSPDATHITGAIPGSDEENVEAGTGVYADATGSVRLSGAVNMANMESKGEATFDCLWVMDITKKDAGGKGAASSMATSFNIEYALGTITLVSLFFLV